MTGFGRVMLVDREYLYLCPNGCRVQFDEVPTVEKMDGECPECGRDLN